MDFEKELETLISKYNKENESDTPDFILAQYLKGCLAIYAEAVKARDKWYNFKGLSELYSEGCECDCHDEPLSDDILETGYDGDGI